MHPHWEPTHDQDEPCDHGAGPDCLECKVVNVGQTLQELMSQVSHLDQLLITIEDCDELCDEVEELEDQLGVAQQDILTMKTQIHTLEQLLKDICTTRPDDEEGARTARINGRIYLQNHGLL